MFSSIFLGFSAIVEQVLVEFCVNLSAVIAGHQEVRGNQGIRLFAFLDDSTMLKNLIVT